MCLLHVIHNIYNSDTVAVLASHNITAFKANLTKNKYIYIFFVKTTKQENLPSQRVKSPHCVTIYILRVLLLKEAGSEMLDDKACTSGDTDAAAVLLDRTFVVNSYIF